MDSSITPLAEHLQELGYVIVDGDAVWLHARHPHKLTLSASLLEGGYIITRWVHITPEGQADRQVLLEAINGLNADALVSRYYVDADGDFTAEAFYTGCFEVASFDEFIAIWDEDFDAVTESDLDRYLI
ncbi:MAG: hypothetical protein R6X16_02705 [Anaerolineae bacterium]